MIMNPIARRYLTLVILVLPMFALIARFGTGGTNQTRQTISSEPVPFERRIEARLVELEHEANQLRELNYERTLQIKRLSKALFKNGTANGLVPSLSDFMENLATAKDPFTPVFQRISSRGPKRNATFVFGLPTVQRPVTNYLMATLANLVSHMNDAEKAESVIVVFIAEVDLNYVRNQTELISEKLANEIESGLIEIISPPKEFYPDLDHLKKTLGDTTRRVKWRTKQNLDFAFLMNYCKDKGLYYVQLEDDIIARRGYVSIMKDFALRKTVEQRDWYAIEFCGLGFIGKMFKARDLKYFIFYFVMSRNEKPCDWLLLYMANTKYCSDVPKFNCQKEINKYWFRYSQALFQHVGLHSSLKGKVQKLVDKRFNKAVQYVKHDNPPAYLNTSLDIYQTYTLEKLYKDRSNFFWAYEPKAGDFIQITFYKPIKLKSVLIRSGTDQHPEDIFDTSTTLSIRRRLLNTNPITNYYEPAGTFDYAGLIKIVVDSLQSDVDAIRIDFRKNATKWVAISEIDIQTL